MIQGSEHVQATVRTHDEASRSGSVLLDDGREISYESAAFDAGGLRTLRLGQRVRIETDPSGQSVLFITLVTLPASPPS